MLNFPISVCVCVCVCLYTHACVELCPTLCDPMDCSPPDFSVRGSGLPFPSSGDLPDPGMEPASLAWPELAGGFFIACST